MQVIITPHATHQFNALPKSEQKKVKRKIITIEDNPFIGKKLSAELEGQRRVRAWPYRILYLIDKKMNTIFITSILHRQGAYK